MELLFLLPLKASLSDAYWHFVHKYVIVCWFSTNFVSSDPLHSRETEPFASLLGNGSVKSYSGKEYKRNNKSNVRHVVFYEIRFLSK
jgi:hypothetical protein